MNHFPKQLSVVVPAYNESARLSGTVKICMAWAKKYPGWEFIFVDDGSSDDTKIKLQKALPGKQFKVIGYKQNQGKGYALKKGVAVATKSLILISDLDFSTPLSQLDLLFPFIAKGNQVIVGSRKVLGANVIEHQSALREFLGRQFTNLSRLWLGLAVSDITCGFKLFSREAGKKLFAKSRIKRWGYDAEILFLAKKYGYKMVDVPVTWKNDAKSKVSIARDIVRSLCDLWMIRVNDVLGRYSNN